MLYLSKKGSNACDTHLFIKIYFCYLDERSKPISHHTQFIYQSTIPSNIIILHTFIIILHTFIIILHTLKLIPRLRHSYIVYNIFLGREMPSSKDFMHCSLPN